MTDRQVRHLLAILQFQICHVNGQYSDSTCDVICYDICHYILGLKPGIS